MCVWSAYSGADDAAGRLWKSLRDIEGLWGGYYTGLVTLEQGEFHWGKCAGCSDTWSRQFDLKNFPGHAGLIHSRTDSGGDWKFAHPFIGWHGKVAAVSQGSTGRFTADSAKFGIAGDFLVQQKRGFRGATHGGTSHYKFNLADGTRVPTSEISTNLVEYYYEQSGDPIAAMKKVAQELPEESATIFLFADRPGEIGVININQHVCVFRNELEVMLAVTALGLPGWSSEIPGNTVGMISPRRCQLESIADCYNIDTRIPSGLVTAALNYLHQHPGCLLAHLVDQAIAPWLKLDGSKLGYRAVLGYRVLEMLATDDRICFEEKMVTGGTGEAGRTFRIYLQE